MTPARLGRAEGPEGACVALRAVDQWSAADAYQMLAYGTGFGLPDGFLVRISGRRE